MTHTSLPAPRSSASGKRAPRAATAAVLGAVLVAGSLSAVPATAATGAEALAPYGGYVQDISIVEDEVSAADDTMTVAVDFCLAPGSVARKGVEDIRLGSATPVASWAEPEEEGGYVYTGEMTVEDASGANTFRVEMLASPVESEVPMADSVFSLYPVSGPATSQGGCGTVELPVQVPLTDFDPDTFEYALEAEDGIGNRFTDTVVLPYGEDADPGAGEPYLGAALIWNGAVEWSSITPEGPAESVSLTLDVPGQCADMSSMTAWASPWTGDWRQGRVSCAQGVVQARIDGLVEEERFIVSATDSSGIEPGESVTARTTINLDGEYDRLERTVELGEAAASFDRPWAPVTHGDLCPVSFKDVKPGGAFFGSIQWLGCEGISAGQANGAFGVNREITRGELATFLMRAYGERHVDPFAASERWWFAPRTSPFKDMKPGSAYYEAATWLRSMGIAGYADGTFKPGKPVSRVEAAQFIYLADHADEDWTAPSESPFADIPTGYSRFEAISYLYASGATRGYTDGTFRSSRDITRGEMAKFVETVFND